MSDHLAVLRRAKGKSRQRYLGPELPAGAAYLWAAYSDLHDSRDQGFGFAPLSEVNIFFYAANRGFRWTLMELKAIRDLDRAHRAHVAERQQKGAA